MATIRDRVQLLVPAGSAQPSVSLTINDWVVPANVPAGTTYIVQVARDKDGFFDIPDKESSPQFQIVAAVAPPLPGGKERHIHILEFSCGYIEFKESKERLKKKDSYGA